MRIRDLIVGKNCANVKVLVLRVMTLKRLEKARKSLGRVCLNFPDLPGLAEESYLLSRHTRPQLLVTQNVPSEPSTELYTL